MPSYADKANLGDGSTAFNYGGFTENQTIIGIRLWLGDHARDSDP